MSDVFLPYPIIAGPTASGKTALAIQLAKQLNGEVVSADSMQIYGDVSVGTARPTIEEMDGIPHHLMGFLPLQEKYSVARYLEDADHVFCDIYARKKTPVMCGGTGLYIQSFMENIQLFDQQPDPDFRAEMQRFATEQGEEALHARLREVDPESAERLHPHDIHRVIRALEVYQTTGHTIGEQTRLSHGQPSRYSPYLFVLDFRDRQVLYNRINRRVDIMLENGLLEEAQRILHTDRDATVTQAIGYKEFEAYFSGEISMQAAADRLRQQTRRYAKRQLSWFRRMSNAEVLYVDETENVDELTCKAIELYRKFVERGRKYAP